MDENSFTYDGQELVAVKDDTGLCTGCFFNTIHCTPLVNLGLRPRCEPSERKDERSVIFKKVIKETDSIDRLDKLEETVRNIQETLEKLVKVVTTDTSEELETSEWTPEKRTYTIKSDGYVIEYCPVGNVLNSGLEKTIRQLAFAQQLSNKLNSGEIKLWKL